MAGEVLTETQIMRHLGSLGYDMNSDPRSAREIATRLGLMPVAGAAELEVPVVTQAGVIPITDEMPVLIKGEKDSPYFVR